MVSVIVPVYRAEAFLTRCVDSILGQSYKDIELILVDDGSPDRCGVICDEYAAKDPRVHVIHQENAGVSAARNAGIEWCLENNSSEWITFIDSDDWIHKGYVETLVTAAEKTGTRIAACLAVFVESYCEDAPIEESETVLMESEQAMVQYPSIGTSCCCKLISKQLLKELRFPVGIRYEDAWISYLLVLSVDQVVMYRKPMYYYYNNPQSFTRDAWSEERMSVITVHNRRLDYFKKNGYKQAWKKEIEVFLENLIQCLQVLMWEKQNNAQYENHFNEMREVLREILHTAKTECGLKLKKDNMWAFFFAAPTDVIWQSAKIAQKIYHGLKKR